MSTEATPAADERATLARSSYILAEGWPEELPRPLAHLKLHWKLVAAVWAMLGVLNAAQLVLTFAIRGTLGEAWATALFQVPRWLLWIPATPVFLWAAQRYPLVQGGAARWRAGAVHLGIAVVLGAVVEASAVVLRLLIDAVPLQVMLAERTLVARAIAQTIGGSLVGVFIYATAVGVITALIAERRAHDREKREAQLAADLASAQVHAIKMQVHPHFLFNTLQAINVLIREDPAAAERMVTLLGQLLRDSLERAESTFVTLRSELHSLDAYFEIEAIRFSDRLTVRRELALDTLEALVPDLILQPLAENAIKHGIAREERGGTITIQSERVECELRITVRNTRTRPAALPTTVGVGLSTVSERLSRLYGTSARFELAHEASETVASIALPLESASIGGAAVPAPEQ